MSDITGPNTGGRQEPLGDPVTDPLTDPLTPLPGANEPGAWSATSTEPDSTRDVASEEAKGVADDAKAAGQQTAATAKEQAGNVASEASSQVRHLLDQAKTELNSQTSAQHKKAAEGVQSVADELSALASGDGQPDGVVSDLARQAADKAQNAASWLQSREPAEVLDEVRDFARRRPGAFLLTAAAVGFIGGRLTRGLADDARDDSSDSATSPTAAPSGTEGGDR